MKKYTQNYLIVLFALSVFFCAKSVSAATFFFEVPKQIPVSGETMVTLKVDTERIGLNAVSGSVIIPQSFELKNIYDGESGIVIWVEKPRFDSSAKQIIFSGITPGGFSGIQKVFSFVLKPAKSGTYLLKFGALEALKNDGKGTGVLTKSTLATILVTNKTSTAVVSIEDTVPPEEFVPSITRSDSIFKNSYFVSFGTNDKGTGIDRYEVASSWLLNPKQEDWQSVSSPYQLSLLQSFQVFYVKAVDKNGNDRLESIWGPYRARAFSAVGMIIVLGYFYLASRRIKR